MSIWYEIKNKEDVELSEDGKSVEILFHNDLQGNYYVDVPLEFITQHICTCGGYPDCICGKGKTIDIN